MKMKPCLYASARLHLLAEVESCRIGVQGHISNGGVRLRTSQYLSMLGLSLLALSLPQPAILSTFPLPGQLSLSLTGFQRWGPLAGSRGICSTPWVISKGQVQSSTREGYLEARST